MKKTVTKAQVIEAIMTEPLAGGHFVHTYTTSSRHAKRSGEFANNIGCAVCAVGGVLDTAFGKKMSSDEISSIASPMVSLPTFQHIDNGPRQNRANVVKEAKSLIRKGYHLSALSMVFEHLFDNEKGMVTSRGLASKRLRKTLGRFVNKNFPNKLTLDTDETY